MERKRRVSTYGLLLSFVLCLLSTAANAGPVTYFSYTGALATPESVFETTFTLSAPVTVTFQTWGFGGGTNAAALFAGPVATATIYTDASGNPLADADNLFNAPWSYVGNCPPAGTVAIGVNQDCGDDFMQELLLAGTYTLVLSDANYIPNALFDNGTLSEGFADLTAGFSRPAIPWPMPASPPTATTRWTLYPMAPILRPRLSLRLCFC
jgi:hypothetical protein